MSMIGSPLPKVLYAISISPTMTFFVLTLSIDTDSELLSGSVDSLLLIDSTWPLADIEFEIANF